MVICVNSHVVFKDLVRERREIGKQSEDDQSEIRYPGNRNRITIELLNQCACGKMGGDEEPNFDGYHGKPPPPPHFFFQFQVGKCVRSYF